MNEIKNFHKLYPKIVSEAFFPEICDGWSLLVDNFFEEMNSAAADFKNNSVCVEQIKEKFGGMRIYVEYHLPDEQILDLEKIVSKYEHLSLRTCTMCGEYDKVMHKRRGYWDIVVCEECFKKD